MPSSTMPSRWHRTGAEAPLLRLIRSSLSGRAARCRRRLRDARRANRRPPRRDRPRAPRAARPPNETASCVLRNARPARSRAPDDLTASRLGGDRRGVRDAAPPSPFDGARSAMRAGGEFRAGRARRARRSRAALPGWRRHFSASALNAYAECARKWFYRYACAAVEDRGSSASAYGTAFHLALEDFHGEFPRPRGTRRAAMRRRMRDCVTWAFERNRDGFRNARRVRAASAARAANRAALRRLAAGARARGAVRGARPRGSGRISSSRDGRSSASSTASIATNAPAASASSTTRRAASPPARGSTPKRSVASRTFSCPSTTGRARPRATASPSWFSFRSRTRFSTCGRSSWRSRQTHPPRRRSSARRRTHA